MEIKDYYQLLGVRPSASTREIKSAYRRLAQQYHPDKNDGDPYATAQYHAIKEAYEVLTDPRRKNEYLEQRWYNQTVNKKSTVPVITPVNVLKQLLELERYVHTLDTHRMDKEGLFTHMEQLLENDTVRVVNEFNEIDVNDAIVETALKCGSSLPLSMATRLAERLTKLRTSGKSSTLINKYLAQKRSVHVWDKYQVWLMLAGVLLICALIFIAAS